MKLSEAKAASYKQFQIYSEQANEINRQREEALKNSRLYPNDKALWEEEAATLEIRYNEYKEKGDQYLDYNSKLTELEVSYANMLNSQYMCEDMQEATINESKMLEVARRIAKGDRVPPEDEKKLMQYNFKLYMTAKQSAVFAKEHKKDESLWKDEEETVEEREDPMEYAGNQEAIPCELPLEGEVSSGITVSTGEGE